MEKDLGYVQLAHHCELWLIGINRAALVKEIGCGFGTIHEDQTLPKYVQVNKIAYTKKKSANQFRGEIAKSAQ